MNKTPNVNPTMNVNREQALSKATTAITKLLRRLEREIDKLSGGRAASRKDELSKAKAVNREKRKKHAMESTYKVVTGLSSADAELVVLPRGFNGGKTPQELHWYFAGGKGWAGGIGPRDRQCRHRRGQIRDHAAFVIPHDFEVVVIPAVLSRNPEDSTGFRLTARRNDTSLDILLQNREGLPAFVKRRSILHRY